MSLSTRTTQNATEQLDRDSPDVLATVVTKSLPYEELPFWQEYRTAAWAIQTTIERVAGEEL